MTHPIPLLCATLLTLAHGVIAASAPKTPPNIVVFLCDDLGREDCSPYGAKDARTPRLQRLAGAGLMFERAYVASPACAPSRTAMLCGLMPARNGAEANHTFARPEIRGLPHYLGRLGYDTVAFGKVAHGDDGPRWGFTHFERPYNLDRVREFVSSRTSGKPLCLFVGTTDPHTPWTKNTEYNPQNVTLRWNFVDTPTTREERADYLTEVTRADADMGSLHDFILEKLGTNTVFLFSSDHGSAWPFGKWNLYEVSTRTPLIATWPGVIPPGSRTDALVSWVDFMPTFIELAGGTPPVGLDGKSFAPILLGRANTHHDEIYTTHSGDGRMNVYPIRALRTDRYKYIRNLFPQYLHTTHMDRSLGGHRPKFWNTWLDAAKTNSAAAAIIKSYHQRPAEELYDLFNDPEERHNLATNPEFATTLQQLRDRLDRWMTEQRDSGKLFNEPYPLDTPELMDAAQGKAGPAPAKAPRNTKRKNTRPN